MRKASPPSTGYDGYSETPGDPIPSTEQPLATITVRRVVTESVPVTVAKNGEGQHSIGTVIDQMLIDAATPDDDGRFGEVIEVSLEINREQWQSQLAPLYQKMAGITPTTHG